MAQKKRLSKIINHLDNPQPAFLQIVGNTPLVYLSSASKEAGTNIYGKCEFLNGAGGSIKDRAALWMILNAEKRGDLIRGKPGIIIEGTGGNTGIGLAVIGKALGYKVIIIIPNTQSIEKKTILRQCGATLIEVEPNPYTSENHYVKFSARFAENLKKEYSKDAKTQNIKILYTNQWDNLSNQQGHIDSTGPEIYEQTDGKITLFTMSVGTGGTITGTSKYLKSRNKDIKICMISPKGGDMYNYFKYNEISHDPDDSSIVEGVGLNGRVTEQLKELQRNGIEFDHLTMVDDKEMMKQIINMQRFDGIMVGLSSGLNVAGAIKAAKYFKCGKQDVVVTMLCDSGLRYANKQYNAEFLKEKGLPHAKWLDNDNDKFFQTIATKTIL